MKKGFTLIELLIVIAIISLLASLAIVSLRSARVKAENTQRLSDINNYITALEAYALDHDGKFPDIVGIATGPNSAFGCLGNDYPNGNCYTELRPIPEDPNFINELDDYFPAMPIAPIIHHNTLGEVEGYFYEKISDNSIKIHWFMQGKDQSCGKAQDQISGNQSNITWCTWSNQQE